MWTLGNVATPATAFTGPLPESVAAPPVRSLARLNVTRSVASVTALPRLSSIVTTTAGEIVESALVLLGCTVNRRRPTWRTVTRTVSLLTPSASAVTRATPLSTAVTTPSASTVAMLGSADVNVTVAPATSRSSASFAVAVSVPCAPIADRVSAVGVTSTEVTTCATVMVALPVTPAVVASILADPFATAVTTPAEVTVATPLADEIHVNVWPETVVPFAPRALPLSDTGSPSETSVALPGDTTTDTTSSGPVSSPPAQAHTAAPNMSDKATVERQLSVSAIMKYR